MDEPYTWPAHAAVDAVTAPFCNLHGTAATLQSAVTFTGMMMTSSLVSTQLLPLV
jgi:hypothetical protein